MASFSGPIPCHSDGRRYSPRKPHHPVLMRDVRSELAERWRRGWGLEASESMKQEIKFGCRHPHQHHSKRYDQSGLMPTEPPPPPPRRIAVGIDDICDVAGGIVPLESIKTVNRRRYILSENARPRAPTTAARSAADHCSHAKIRSTLTNMVEEHDIVGG